MGVVLSAGWAVVTKSGDVLARMQTKKAARRRVQLEQARGRECRWVELWYSTGLTETE